MTKKEIKKPNITSQPFAGIIEKADGKRKLRLNSPAFFQSQLEKFPIGTRLTLWMDGKPPTRSQQQNRLYWMYLGVIADDTGHSVDELHSYFKGKLLSDGLTEVYGHKVRKTKSTTTLNKNDFAEYMFGIQEISGIEIPNTELHNPTTYFGAEQIQNYPVNNLGEPTF